MQRVICQKWGNASERRSPVLDISGGTRAVEFIDPDFFFESFKELSILYAIGRLLPLHLSMYVNQ